VNEEWMQFMARQAQLQTRHLPKIQTYAGALLGIVIAGIALYLLLFLVGFFAGISAL
jgi:hypothetical protein